MEGQYNNEGTQDMDLEEYDSGSMEESLEYSSGEEFNDNNYDEDSSSEDIRDVVAHGNYIPYVAAVLGKQLSKRALNSQQADNSHAEGKTNSVSGDINFKEGRFKLQRSSANFGHNISRKKKEKTLSMKKQKKNKD